MINTDKYNCIIIDDDDVDRLTTLSFVRKYPFLNICGICASATVALSIIQQREIHVLFLDIDMPGTNGLDLRRKMMDIPVCVFITSFADCALESFELAALDFLVKPLKADRFEATIVRVKAYLESRQKASLYDFSLGAGAIFIKDGHNFVKVNLHEILYLEALKDYTLIITSAKRYCVLSPISNLLKDKNFHTFIRIHRSYAVQKHLINKIMPNHVMIADNPIPIGRSYKDSLEAIKAL
jgi:DNA-binding LytR/AlgR family response regulator